MNAASFVGRVVPTIFAPRCGVFNMLIFFTYAMAALLFAMGGLTNAAGFTVFAVLFGFFSGGGEHPVNSEAYDLCLNNASE